jgi:hypothetical protein
MNNKRGQHDYFANDETSTPQNINDTITQYHPLAQITDFVIRVFVSALESLAWDQKS